MLTSWTINRIITAIGQEPKMPLRDILTEHINIAKDDAFDTVISWLKQMNQYDTVRIIESERQRLKDEGLF